MSKAPQLVVLAGIFLVALIVAAAVVLSVTGNPIPAWFEVLAFGALTGSLGAYQSPPGLSAMTSGAGGAPVPPPTPPAPPAA